MTLLRSVVGTRLVTLCGREWTAGSVDGNGWTDLHYAAALDLPEAAEALLTAGARVDAALASDRKSLTGPVRAVLGRCGLDMSGFGRMGDTPLHVAAYTGARNVLTVLLRHGAGMYALDCDGWTPLHYAIQRMQPTVLKLLLAHGADVGTRDKELGLTLLHFAALCGNREMVEVLLAGGGDIDADSDEGTPLHVAALRGDREVVTALLAGGADVGASGRKGETPLHSAAGGRLGRRGRAVGRRRRGHRR